MCDQDCERCVVCECIYDEKNSAYNKITIQKNPKKKVFLGWEDQRYLEENYERQYEF